MLLQHDEFVGSGFGTQQELAEPSDAVARVTGGGSCTRCALVGSGFDQEPAAAVLAEPEPEPRPFGWLEVAVAVGIVGVLWILLGDSWSR